MDEQAFPANSRAQREDKKVEKVVTGSVSRRRTPLGKRLAQTFVADDASGVGGYILFDVLIPAFKDVIADVVSQGIERVLYGGARSTSRRTGARPSSSGYTSYNRYSSAGAPPWKREEKPQLSRRARGSFDFDEIILATRGEATEVIDKLFELVSKYEEATVADLYELVGITGTFTDEKWGWRDLRGAGVTRVSGGYLLDLPKPEPLS